MVVFNKVAESKAFNDAEKMTQAVEFSPRVVPRATWRDYVAIARPDHWIKHVFVLPGVVVALVIGADGELRLGVLALGFAVAALISSANYVINEWLDVEFDRHHPLKSARPGVARALDARIVYAEHIGLAATGLALAYVVSLPLLAVALLFLISGWVYNIRPLRTKDKAYLDVATEAINNPIRLMLGWVLVDPGTVPPASLLLAYWAGGAFLMSTKRLAEYRSVVMSRGVAVLHRYRRSFQSYSEQGLLLQSFLYALIACFFIGVFLMKYRIEYVLSFPLFALLFTVYLHLGLKEASVAQTPEKLFRETAVLGVVAALVITLIVLTIVDLPWLEFLSVPHLIRLPS